MINRKKHKKKRIKRKRNVDEEVENGKEETKKKKKEEKREVIWKGNHLGLNCTKVSETNDKDELKVKTIRKKGSGKKKNLNRRCGRIE